MSGISERLRKLESATQGSGYDRLIQLQGAPATEAEIDACLASNGVTRGERDFVIMRAIYVPSPTGPAPAADSPLRLVSVKDWQAAA